MKKNYKQKEISVFRLTPTTMGVHPFSNGDIPLSEMPEKDKKYNDIIILISKFINEYLLEKHPETLVTFHPSGMLQAELNNQHMVYYHVFTRDEELDKDLEKEITLASLKFFLELFEKSSLDQQDMFEVNSLTELEIIDIDFEEANLLAEDFIKKNKNLKLNNTLSVSSDRNMKPLKITGHFKSPIVNKDLSNEPSKTIFCLFEGIFLPQSKIHAKVYTLDSQNSKSASFLAFDATVLKNAKKLFGEVDFFKATTVANYIKKIESWEGPKGPLA